VGGRFPRFGRPITPHPALPPSRQSGRVLTMFGRSKALSSSARADGGPARDRELYVSLPISFRGQAWLNRVGNTELLGCVNILRQPRVTVPRSAGFGGLRGRAKKNRRLNDGR